MTALAAQFATWKFLQRKKFHHAEKGKEKSEPMSTMSLYYIVALCLMSADFDFKGVLNPNKIIEKFSAFK